LHCSVAFNSVYAMITLHIPSQHLEHSNLVSIICIFLFFFLFLIFYLWAIMKWICKKVFSLEWGSECGCRYFYIKPFTNYYCISINFYI
jgi:hypothetical protein